MKACHRCGRTSHEPKDCRFKDAQCHNCGKRGHIAPVCRSPKKKHQPRRNNPKKAGLGTRYVTAANDQDPEPEEDEESLPLYTVGGGATPPIKVPLTVDGKISPWSWIPAQQSRLFPRSSMITSSQTIS